ncbi:SMI1/KNR4 family protein [Gottschalkia acidurici]|nr:SMI1/KNR4 family protein [Gottschalkia acidurici]
MNWQNVFEKEYFKNQGASKEEIEKFKKTWNSELTKIEIIDINSRQKNPFHKSDKNYELYKPFNLLQWKIPKNTLPDSYIEFLKYSNGGEFQNGDRYFQIFSTSDFRQMNIEYEFPEYMEGSISFAMDGSGNHLVFNMRKKRNNGEYPILSIHSGSLGYDDCKLIGSSFIEVCTGKTSIY